VRGVVRFVALTLQTVLLGAYVQLFLQCGEFSLHVEQVAYAQCAELAQYGSLGPLCHTRCEFGIAVHVLTERIVRWVDIGRGVRFSPASHFGEL
jgi:hypothetical protein